MLFRSNQIKVPKGEIKVDFFYDILGRRLYSVSSRGNTMANFWTKKAAMAFVALIAE